MQVVRKAEEALYFKKYFINFISNKFFIDFFSYNNYIILFQNKYLLLKIQYIFNFKIIKY